MNYINKNTGDIIEFSVYHRLSPEAREKYIEIKSPSNKTDCECDESLSVGDGIALATATVVLSPVILWKSIFG